MPQGKVQVLPKEHDSENKRMKDNEYLQIDKYIVLPTPIKLTLKAKGKSQPAAKAEELKSTERGKFPASLHD